MTRVTCVNLKEVNTWKKYLASIPSGQRDIFFTPEYYAAYENYGAGVAQCFILEREGDVALYPFLMNRVGDDGFFDISGAYGYNGILATTRDSLFVKTFQEAFLDFCKESRIIAEFTRFHPLLKNECFSGYMKIIHQNDNVVVDLSLSEEEIWKTSYAHAVRKSVNKAKRLGLRTEIVEGKAIREEKHFEMFLAIFHTTLDRNKASASSYYNAAFLRSLIHAAPENFLLIFSYLEDHPISTEFVLLSPEAGYSFLGGTLEETYPYRPNHLLKHDLICYLKRRGKRYYCIGGGRAMGDNLFRYKKSYAIDGVYPFYVGTKIHNEEIYHQICQDWMVQNPVKAREYEGLLLKYRL